MENIVGIEYNKPKVYLINEYGLGVSEIAARTCYDSYLASENESIKKVKTIKNKDIFEECNLIESSDLLDNLAWVHHHHSILEHTTLSFLIEGTSRGVLQEHARHRMQAISVRSTRYTMADIINYFIISLYINKGKDYFIKKVLNLDMFVISNKDYNKIEIESIYKKLLFQFNTIGDEEFFNASIAKSLIEEFNVIKNTNNVESFETLLFSKKKRNVGDSFKHIVSDNWKVDLVVTFNLRSLKNYFQLRDSGAAYFQIQWLAQEMKKVIPEKYLDLIVKRKEIKE